jgi:hypothetical protein
MEHVFTQPGTNIYRAENNYLRIGGQIFTQRGNKYCHNGEQLSISREQISLH